MVALPIIWLRAVIVLWPFLPPWWFLFIILFKDRNISRWPIMYSSMTFSIETQVVEGSEGSYVVDWLTLFVFWCDTVYFKCLGAFFA